MWFVAIAVLAGLAFMATGGHPLAWVENLADNGRPVSSFTKGQKYLLWVATPKGFAIEALRQEFAQQYGYWFTIVAPEQRAGTDVGPDGKPKNGPDSDDTWYLPVLANNSGNQADVAAVSAYGGDIGIRQILAK
jgi:hypothetical protein